MLELKCNKCNKIFNRRKDSVDICFKKYNMNLCVSCIHKTINYKKTQCNKSFWTTEQKDKHSKTIKSSSSYYESLKHRNTSGPNNSMFGKTHSIQTKRKMSQSRKGKFGINSTAWKGGKKSLNNRVKSYIQKNYKWYSRIFERDKICQHCGINKQLDAHHIEPITKIIKRILIGNSFSDDIDKFTFIVNHTDIRDDYLKNGICLCRICHKNVHHKWGSHNAT